MGNPHAQSRNRPKAVANAEAPYRSRGNTPLNRTGKWWRSPIIPVIVGGILMGLCPAPVNAWPLAWIALVPLWGAVANPSGMRPGQGFRLGLLWSVTYHGMALAWITALHPLMWLGIPWLGSIAIALFAWGFITLLGGVTFGLWAALMQGAIARFSLPVAARILLGTALWCGLETGLSWGPLYWPSLSYTQSPGNLWILHLGQISGPMAVTAAIVAVNGCWAEAWASFRNSEPKSSVSRKRTWAITLSGLFLLLGLQAVGWKLYHYASAPDATDKALTVGLIQGNVPTRIKLTPEGTRRAVQGYAEGYRALVDQGASLVVTPEGAIPEIWHRNYQGNSPVYRAVIEKGIPLLLGTFRPGAEANTLTQSVVALDAAGQVYGQYNKVKLVPLGEYIPLQAVLGRVISRLSPVDSSLSPGSLDQVFETPVGRAIAGICYESAYSELFRRQAAQGGEWILTASNNDPYPPRMMMQHHAQDVMRAIESDRWAARVTNTGISGIVTPHGETRWLSEPNQYTTHLDTIYRRQTRTLYVRWGDWLTPLLLLGSGVAIALSQRSLHPSR
jgi:apolipoprotein N-acyltransferase